MKIIVLASLAYSLVNFRRALLVAMKNAGHEIIACAPEDDAEVISTLTGMGIRYHRIPMQRTGLNPFADLQTLAGYMRLIRHEKPDVVLAYTQKPIIYGGLATQMIGHARFFAMVSGLGYAFAEECGRFHQLLRKFVARLYRLGIRKAEAVFVFNRDDRGEMLRHHVLRPDQYVLQVPGSGIDIRQFPARPIPDGPPVFLLIARLLRDKGLFEYVEAARQIRARHPDARMQLLGPLDSNPACISRETLDQWIAEGVIEYLGETRDVKPYLANATVYVLPSTYREGLPRTVLEAMSTGRAIITTDSPGCREPVIEGQNGFLVPVRNPDALAKAMLRLVENPELAVKMGAQSRRLAEDRYDVDKVNAILLGAMGLDEPQSNKTPANETPHAFHASSRVRRVADSAIAGLAAIVALPLMILIGLSIALFMGRPVLFTQLRAGRGDRPFRLIKFRTMAAACDDKGQPLPDDARMTALGRFLRRSRFDELPELWNILKSDMGIIGPRPLLPETVAAMGERGQKRGMLRPGLTGWAQVNGNALLTDSDKLALDLWYIDHASWRLDLHIIVKTIGVILIGEHINHRQVGKAYAGGHRRRG